MTKQELIKLGQTVLGDHPELEMVLVTADGQVFEPGKRWAAESHARQKGLSPELLTVKHGIAAGSAAKTTEAEQANKPLKMTDHS